MRQPAVNCTFYMHIISSYDYDDISTNKRQQKESKDGRKTTTAMTFTWRNGIPTGGMILLVLLNTISSAFSLSVSSGSGCTYDDATFDFYLFVQQWPATQSAQQWPEGANTSDFSIHGAWPSRTGSDASSYPCKCTTETFDESKVSSIMQEMTARWSSYGGENKEFWSHEWSKHGTCSQNRTQLSYFQQALNIREEAKILSTLAAANIVPSDSATYTLEDLETALGKDAIYGCTSSKLSEVALCVSKTDMFTRIPCDPSVLSHAGEFNDCPSTGIKFPVAQAPSPSPSPSPSPTPAIGRCATYGCGGYYDPSRPCQCTKSCSDHDDCCPDYKSVCEGNSTTCVAGQKGPPCSNDADCSSYSDCVRCASSGFCTCVDLGTGKCA